MHRERVPGSRRDYYRMPDDVWDKMMRLRDQVLGRWAACSARASTWSAPDTPAGARMAEHAAFVEFVTRENARRADRAGKKYRAERA